MNRQMLSARLLVKTQDSVLLPLTAVVLTVAICVRRLQKLPWAPILGPVSESGKFFSQGIPSLGLANIRGTFLVLKF